MGTPKIRDGRRKVPKMMGEGLAWQPPVPPRISLPSDGEHPPGLFWRPNKAFIAALGGFLTGKRVLEIFAGNGLLAGYLARDGIAVTATSLLTGMDAHEHGLYHPVENMDACAAVQRFRDDHDVLLICWPTVTETVTRAALSWGMGKDIVFIGEVTDYAKNHLGGCATDSFFETVKFTRTFNEYQGNMLEQACVGQVSPIHDLTK